jgi:hypothetical protein
MIFELFADPVTWWLFGTAVVFTHVGQYMAFKNNVNITIAATIDSLIEDGYIKTKLKDNELVLIKHTDWSKGDK